MASGCSRAAGTAGQSCSRAPASPPLTPGWPDDPETVADAKAHPEVFAGKTVGQVGRPLRVGDRRAEREAGGDRTFVRRAADADRRGPRALRRRRSRSTRRRSAACSRCRCLRSGRRRRCCAIPSTAGGRSRSPTSSSATPSRTRSPRARRGSSTRRTPCRLPGCPSSKPRPRTSIRGPRRRSTPATPARGPLLIISGEQDHTVPRAIAHASYKRQQRNAGVTEFIELPKRGHSLTIDSGWREVAGTALAFVKRFS